jgi:mannitol/fructose-specific phosphotransferase system IIA component
MIEEIIHIKITSNVKDELISDMMNLLIKNGFKTEKYLGQVGKIIMARKEEDLK